MTNLILRYQDVSAITYTIELWLPKHFAEWDAFIAPIMAGKDLRPNPRVWQLQDLRVAHNKINLLVFTECSAQMLISPGKWGYDLSFGEKPRQKLLGGAVKSAPEVRPFGKSASELAAENKGLDGKLESMGAAKKAGK